MGATLEEGLYAWRPDRAEPWQPIQWCDPGEGSIVAADSWRVREGRVRGLDLHRDRFLAAAGRALTQELLSSPESTSPTTPAARPLPVRRGTKVPALVHTDPELLADFWRDVVAALPRTGDWFPRVELRERGTLTLRLRLTPATTSEVVVATAPYDPRTVPAVKGPDLDALLSLRTAVQPLGAGEAIILDAHGRLIDGAYSALMWWRDGILTAPPVARTRVRSVTAALILEAARGDGIPTAVADARPDDLAGCELWVLSALHGVRLATDWIEGPLLTASAERVRWANIALEKRSRTLPATA